MNLRREYAVHDTDGNSRGSAPWGSTDEERLASCIEEAQRLTEMWAERHRAMAEFAVDDEKWIARDVFTVVTREVTEWEPV